MVKFQFNIIICSTAIAVLIIAFFTGFVNASKKYKYESSYAFMDAQNNEQICVNFQQWRSRDLPSSAANSVPKMMKWWIPPNGTNICKDRRAERFTENDIIPAEYLTRMAELDECDGRIGFNQTDTRAVRNEVAVMKEQGVRNILFIVQKGKINGYGLPTLLSNLKPEHFTDTLSIIQNKTNKMNVMHDYLFTHFYNGEIDDADESMNIFYIYEHNFNEQIQVLPIIGQQQFRIYQPQSSLPMDPAVVVIWFFAFSSILIGSLWAAADTRGKIAIRLMEEGSQTELNQEEGESSTTETTVTARAPPQSNDISPRAKDNKNAMKRTESGEIAQMSGWQHCCSVGFALFVVVSVLMLAYFFRDFAVNAFNIITVILGTFSIHSCFYALFKLAIGKEFDFKIGTFRQLFCGKCRQNPQQNEDQMEEVAQQTQKNVSSSHLDRPIFLFSSLLFIISASICIFWFTIRNNAYSFLLLDPINLAICIFTIRGSRIRSLRLITFLLLAMFGYDLFMVFGTRLLTPDGCSVMLQVVTGTDCRPKSTTNSTKQYHQQIAPIDAVLPQKIPLVFYVPILADPMAKCYDLEVEREYKHVMLGLGDVILPGYLIAFCFYMDVIEKNRFHTYGLISIIGYSLGMASTFIALLIMETGQPALIYLVPFTLIPVCLWAFFGDEKGTLAKMWKGEV